MVLTRDYRESVRERMERDPAFRRALLQDAVEVMISGEVDLAKTLLRDYINASLGFAELGRLTGKSPKSLMRMFGPAGNPQAVNLFDVIRVLQQHEGIRLAVRAEATEAA
jgi:DNA-binding phage protein